jgi:hypothetical protein
VARGDSRFGSHSGQSVNAGQSPESVARERTCRARTWTHAQNPAIAPNEAPRAPTSFFG